MTHSFIKTFFMGAIGSFSIATVASADNPHGNHMDEAPYYNNRPVPCWKVGTCPDEGTRRYLIGLSTGLTKGNMSGDMEDLSYDHFSYGVSGEATLSRHFRIDGAWETGKGDVGNEDVTYSHANAGLQIRGPVSDYWDIVLGLGAVYEKRKNFPGEDKGLDSIEGAISLGFDTETNSRRFTGELTGTAGGDFYLGLHPRWRVSRTAWLGMKAGYETIKSVYSEAEFADEQKEQGINLEATLEWRF
jgi:hypothetical protein